jgi:hypothetical protein
VFLLLAVAKFGSPRHLTYCFSMPRIFCRSTTSRGEPPPRANHFSKLATLILYIVGDSHTSTRSVPASTAVSRLHALRRNRRNAKHAASYKDSAFTCAACSTPSASRSFTTHLRASATRRSYHEIRFLFALIGGCRIEVARSLYGILRMDSRCVSCEHSRAAGLTETLLK